MKKKSVVQVDFKTFVENVEKSNQKFESATPAERIVMVAEDVLSMLGLGRLKAQTGTYVALKIEGGNLGDYEKCQVSDLLKKAELPACEVCAIGGAMVAATLRLNKVPAKRFLSLSEEEDDEEGTIVFDDGFGECETDTMSARAAEVFPVELLRDMESAFENCYHGYTQGEDAERLIAIYTNLIKNKGEKFTRYEGDEVVWEPYLGEVTSTPPQAHL